MIRTQTAAFALAAFSAAACCSADVNWVGSAGQRSASANFHISGTSLQVTLTNISNFDVTEPVGVMTGVFFNVTGSALSLTPQSAIVPGGSTVLFGSTGPGNSVGGEWAYKSAPMTGFTQGISASGLGIFGPGDVFPGSGNLQGPDSPGGLEYGMTSSGDNPATGNTPVTGTNALIKNAVVFTFSGLPANFDLNRINAVRMQYGTDLSEPHLDADVPAPGAASVLALGALLRRRRRA